MRLSLILVTAVCFTTIYCNRAPSTSIPYPPAPPKDSIVSFLPNIVCSGGDSIDFNATFSHDGKSFYFTRSRNRSWDIFVTQYNGTSWTKAGKISFDTDQYSEADPAIGPDGYLYFISNMPKDKHDTIPDFDIWFARPEAGGWSKPENLGVVNTDSTEYYVSFAGNGNLYFASSRPGGYGMEDLYVSRNVEGKLTAPENLGPQVNSQYSDHDAALPKNESFMIYTSVDRKEGLGEGDLYYSIKDAHGMWSEGKQMSKKWNTPTYEYCSYFSPDQKFFFYSSRRDVKWTSVETLPAELYDLMK